MRTFTLALITIAAGCGNNSADDVASLPDLPSSPDMTMSAPDMWTPGDPLLVNTDKGAVQGMSAGAARLFLGIPYAAPPIGPLRWKPPQPAAAWTTPRDGSIKGATAMTAPCTQFDVFGNFNPMSSEDCLYVNVWAPLPVTSKAPVMVFIHGGGFTSGSGGDPTYDGTHLASTQGVVVVTMNYRLGPLGFLGHSGLAAEDTTHPWAGNYGLEDQRAALQWVQTNAAAFGGDPANVTIFGESAGGFSVCFHMLSPASKGLFARAIVESGSCAIPVPDAAAGNAQATRLATALGCSGSDSAQLTCMRGKSAKDVVSILPLKPEILFGAGEQWSPIAEGHDVPGQPIALLKSGTFTKVPLLIGTNHDEGAIFFLFGGKISTDAQYKTALEQTYTTAGGDSIYAKYPSASFASPQKALETVIADATFVCPARRLARASAAATQPTFRYEFERAPTTMVGNLGSTHSMELPFVFGNVYIGFDPTVDPNDKLVANAMQAAWAKFAASGSPSVTGGFTWPAYDTMSETYAILDAPLSTGTKLHNDVCDYWDTLTP